MSYTEDTESYPIEQTSAEFFKNLKKKILFISHYISGIFNWEIFNLLNTERFKEDYKNYPVRRKTKQSTNNLITPC